jgi:para-nitrobenzyl esterase
VQSNIQNFGGDASRVTIFGQSAGGSSVCQQLVSPSAAGLFQRAILQSGPCTYGTATREKALATGNALAEKLGCAAGAGQLDCLRSKSADDVFSAAPSLDFNDLSTLQVLTPWVDGVVLPKAPMDLIKKGRFNRVPIMIGNTQDEATLFIALAFEARLGAPMSEEQYQALALQSAGNKTTAALITANYSSKRFGSPNLAASALVTDAMFACGTQASARALSAHTPTYAYEFQESVPPLIADPFMEWGAYHASELPLIFQTRILTTPLGPDPRDVATPAQLVLSDKMMEYWGRFAAAGNPNGQGAVNWPRFVSGVAATQQFNASKINTNVLSGIFNKHQCLLWDTATAFGLGL